MHYVGLVSQSLLFELAGISFFMSYILAVLAFIRTSKSLMAKVFGTLTFVTVSVVFVSMGIKIIYPAVMFLTGYAIDMICNQPGNRKSINV
jgi:hypothetical protein